MDLRAMLEVAAWIATIADVTARGMRALAVTGDGPETPNALDIALRRVLAAAAVRTTQATSDGAADDAAIAEGVNQLGRAVFTDRVMVQQLVTMALGGDDHDHDDAPDPWWRTADVDGAVTRLASTIPVDVNLWLDEYPGNFRQELISEAAMHGSPLADIARTSALAHQIDRQRTRASRPSLRRLRSDVDAFIGVQLEQLTARPLHGGWGVSRLGQPVRVRQGEIAFEPILHEHSDLARRERVYLPKGADELHDEEVRGWQDVRDRWLHTVVLGEPGYGKSWLLRREALTTLKDARRQRREGVEPYDLVLPLWVRLDDIADALEDCADMAEATARAAVQAHVDGHHQYSDDLAQWMAAALRAQGCRWPVLLDGLDEVTAPETRKRLLDHLRRWRPSTRVVLTSRPTGFPGFPLGSTRDAGVVELVPFGRGEVSGFLEQWFGLNAIAARELSTFMLSRPWLAGMARIPLLLSLLCLLLSHVTETGAIAPPKHVEVTELRDRMERLPRRRAELYRQVLLKLFAAGHRERRSSSQTATDPIDRLLAHVARIAWGFGTYRGWHEQLDHEHIIATLTADPRLDQAAAEDVLAELTGKAGVLITAGRSKRGQRRFRFLHRTFHEYLCAVHIHDAVDNWQAVLHERLWFNDDWHEVLVLFVGVADTPEDVLDNLTAQQFDPFEHALALAVRATAELSEKDEALAGPVVSTAISHITMPASDVRTALRRAVEIGGPHASAALVTAIQDGDRALRRAAAWALVGCADPDALRALRALLGSGDVVLQVAAAEALTATKDPHALDDLVGRLGDDAELVRRAAADAIADTADEDALSAVIQLADDPDPQVRAAAVRALSGTPAETRSASLVAHLTDADPAVRIAAIAALARTPNVSTTAMLRDRLADADPKVRIAAVSALAHASDASVTAMLRDCLADPHPEVEASAIRALSGTADPEALALLAQRIAEDDAELRMLAAEAIAKSSSSSVVPALLEHLRAEQPAARMSAAEALTGKKDPAALRALQELCDDADPRVRLAALAALPERTAAITQSVIGLLGNSDPGVRHRAAELLAGADTPEAMSALVLRLDDEDEAVRHAAAYTLRDVRAPTACLEIVEHIASLDRMDAELALDVLHLVAPQAWRCSAADHEQLLPRLAHLVDRLRGMI